MNEESIFVTLGCFSTSLTYRCASCCKCCINSWAWPWIQLCQHVARWRCRLWYNVDRLFARSLDLHSQSCPAVRIGPISVWAANYGCFCLQKCPRRLSRWASHNSRTKALIFSKTHESDCKPSTCLACSYLNWREEVSAALCSAVDRQTIDLQDYITYVVL